jgi:hypothetical protein
MFTGIRPAKPMMRVPSPSAGVKFDPEQVPSDQALLRYGGADLRLAGPARDGLSSRLADMGKRSGASKKIFSTQSR